MAGLLLLRKCPCLKPKIEEEVRVLDYRHSSLTDVPGDVFNFERTLEELYTDSNQIRELPRELFYCHGLRKLSVSDNEITNIPPAIASLDHLEELDFSKNGIIDVPDNIKCCKYLRVIDASVNPLGKLPEGFTQLQNLTHLFLNDTFLDYLPGSFGRLVKLRILEIRENHLKTLPKSFGRLVELERLDIGNNEFTELPDVIGTLTSLLELWCDNNQITSITHTIGGLKQLMFFDASKNQLQSVPGEIEGCTSLADLHLSSNELQLLPDAIGNLSNLTTLKVDDNQLTSLPRTLGGLTSLSELNVSVNDLEELPASIGLLRNLRTFYADENMLTFVPAELGSCSGITVLSLRSNKLTYIPDEIGRIPRLRVLNLSDNRLNYLPFTIIKLKELQALWLTENQTRPLIPLQSDYEPDTGRKILTCYLLPQGQNSDNDVNVGEGDTDSFHPSMWDEERQQRQQIHFNFIDEEDDQGHLVRCPTPYPKEMREKQRHMRNLALRQSMGDGGQAGSWTPPVDRSQMKSVLSPEGKGSYGFGPGDEEKIDVRIREARIAKAQSPSLRETHRLYHYDKEKLLKDKARLQQHRHSMPNIADQLSASTPNTPRAVKRGRAARADMEDLRVSGRRKSTPNLLSFEDKDEEVTPKGTLSFTYEDLYQKQLLQKHHSLSRRSRRMREYDSDTGYRSDRDVQFFRRHSGNNYKDSGSVRDRDDLSVRSQPTMSRSNATHHAGHHHRRHGKEGGYASDLEAYAGRGRGMVSRNLDRETAAPSPRPHPLHPTHSLPQDLNVQIPSVQKEHAPSPHPSSVPRANPDYPASKGYQLGAAGQSVPSQFADSTSLASGMAQQKFAAEATEGSGVYAQTARNKGGQDLQRELYTVLEERSKKAASGDLDGRPSPFPSSSRNTPAGHTPPPYQPAPPYKRPSDRASDHSDSFSQESPRDTSKGNNSFSNPEYTAIQYNTSSQGRTDMHGVFAVKDYETVALVHHGPDSVYSSSSNQGQRRSFNLGQGYSREGGRPRSESNSSDRTSHSGGCASVSGGSGNSEQKMNRNQDFALYSTSSGMGSHHGYTAALSSHHLPSSSYISDQAVRRSRDNNLTSVQSFTNCDPVSRRSPRHLDLPTLSRPRSGSTDNLVNEEGAVGGLAPQKVFDGYLNPYSEPLEVGAPLMSRYEDVALFKTSGQTLDRDPSSQVSSSTDSGYGHGHHIYERIGDFNQLRQSGSPHSSTPPSHRNTPVRHNSSSQGTPSRETTPVKESGFYSLHNSMTSESNTQVSRDVFRTVIRKNPGLGFSIAGGVGSTGFNPFRQGDTGIFVTKVQPGGPASAVIQPGDKILEVNHINFATVDHAQAVNIMKTATTVELLIERVQKINMV